MGRHSTLNPEVQSRIAALVNGGAPIPLACKAAGVSWNTAKTWMSRGRAGEEPYASFVEAMDQAKAAWACAAALRVTKAGGKDWKASAWLLERRVKAFRKPTQVELSGRDGGAIETASTVRYVVQVPPAEQPDEE